jgi:hypothetical protein
MTARRFYLSGPMSGYPGFNADAFQAATDVLRARGYIVASPHESLVGSDTDAAWNVAVRSDLAVMLACDAVILLKGWPQSKGARLELQTALGLGMPVFYLEGERLIDFNREAA